ncbi:hypothetical protein ACFOJE_02515 [Azotobacter bryophylli]|uniref:Uncharacterized protein n=1 Tax=Azotobacter bryophylli TaxID=1986537 RepID=A0ABV7AP82_9GAMM
MSAEWLIVISTIRKGKAMIQRPDKVRQAGLIIFAITVLLILPNLSRFVS